jgi:hypothetical protein
MKSDESIDEIALRKSVQNGARFDMHLGQELKNGGENDAIVIKGAFASALIVCPSTEEVKEQLVADADWIAFSGLQSRREETWTQNQTSLGKSVGREETTCAGRVVSCGCGGCGDGGCAGRGGCGDGC